MREVDLLQAATKTLREGYTSRRQVLRMLPAGLGALLLSASDVPAADEHQPRAIATPRAPGAPKPAPPRHGGAPDQHGRAALSRPVFTLREYRRAVPGPAFPRDAVALTIDDGPHPVWTPKILRLLAHHHVPATFCMIGNQVLGHEATARDVVRDGHQVANHTWSHPTHLARKHGAKVSKEIERAQDKIYSTTGHTPAVFRSPGGDWSSTVLGAAANAGMVPLDWSDDPRDWSRPGTAAIRRRLLAARPGQILLCHDGGGDRSQTYAALKTVVPALKARGYRFIALDGRR
ncbi:polysaccharide deacetylase family protein [Actinoplanes sp. NPDC049316]|uniref:polysaccharide deacetylase family protein n=1 Tax=Actinoplanes sp. NPDC049316 TaxID=3154727 RepID=UPI0034394473